VCLPWGRMNAGANYVEIRVCRGLRVAAAVKGVSAQLHVGLDLVCVQCIHWIHVDPFFAAQLESARRRSSYQDSACSIAMLSFSLSDGAGLGEDSATLEDGRNDGCALLLTPPSATVNLSGLVEREAERIFLCLILGCLRRMMFVRSSPASGVLRAAGSVCALPGVGFKRFVPSPSKAEPAASPLSCSSSATTSCFAPPCSPPSAPSRYPLRNLLAPNSVCEDPGLPSPAKVLISWMLATA